MPDLSAQRTLVKSPPELWSELSELERLANHLGAFGEIRITRLEPEHTVAWEGERASGTVSIEPAGWGTKVTLNATIESEEPATEEPAEPPAPSPRQSWFARWLTRRRTAEPAPVVEERPEPEEPPVVAEAQTVLNDALEALGSAHHRPFSRG